MSCPTQDQTAETKGGKQKQKNRTGSTQNQKAPKLGTGEIYAYIFMLNV